MNLTHALEQQFRFRAAVPRLPVTDLTATLDYYVGTLGFRPLYRDGADAGVGLGEIILRFCTGEPIRHEAFSVYFETERVDALFERFSARAIEVWFAPQNMPWGSREFGVLDPDGYRLIFGDFRLVVGHQTTATEAVLRGDLASLSALLAADPALATMRLARRAENRAAATLLHVLMDYPNGNHPPNATDVARALLDSGANVNALDGVTEGSSALQLLVGIESARPQTAALTDVLLAAGAVTDICNSDQSGMDALSVALLHGHTESAALMFAAGYPANFSWVGAGLGDMALVRTFYGDADDVRLPTSERKAALGPEAEGAVVCAFLVAAINGQTQVLQFLLDKGVDVNVQPPGSDFAGIGGTALHWAARNGREETIRALLTAGGDPRRRDDLFDLTPAGWASWFGHEASRLLLEHAN